MPTAIFILPLVMLITTLSHADSQGLTPYSNSIQPPAFKLQDTQGNTVALSDYHGTVLIINFWATWCPPCIKEMPSLQRAWEQLKQEGIQVVAINAGESKEEIVKYTRQQALGFPLLLDPDMSVATAWSVKGLPTSYVLDPSGRTVFRVIGELQWDDPAVAQQIRSLLKETSEPSWKSKPKTNSTSAHDYSFAGLLAQQTH